MDNQKLRLSTEHRRLSEQPRTAFEAETKVLNIIASSVLESHEQFSRIGEQIARIRLDFDQHLRGDLQRVAEARRQAPVRTRAALRTLGEHGWYLDMEMTPGTLAQLAESFDHGDIEAAEGTLATYYRERLVALAADLVHWFSARQRILGRAFDAHHRGEYELSVPVFLAQADGICQECLGVQLYSKRGGKPRTAHAIEARQLAQDSLEAALLHPFELTLPISASAPERRSPGIEALLNRHRVLHGVEVNYGTELNSLKAISLLYYVASVLRSRESDGV